MKLTIKNNEFYLNDVKLDKLISYSIDANVDRTKLTIELILDDIEIEKGGKKHGNELRKTYRKYNRLFSK